MSPDGPTVSTQVIDQSLHEVGIDTSVRMLDFGAWSDRRTRGDFDLSMGWSNIGPLQRLLSRPIVD